MDELKRRPERQHVPSAAAGFLRCELREEAELSGTVVWWCSCGVGTPVRSTVRALSCRRLFIAQSPSHTGASHCQPTYNSYNTEHYSCYMIPTGESLVLCGCVSYAWARTGQDVATRSGARMLLEVGTKKFDIVYLSF